MEIIRNKNTLFFLKKIKKGIAKIRSCDNMNLKMLTIPFLFLHILLPVS